MRCCCICFEELPKTEGVECAAQPEPDFTCRECFTHHVDHFSQEDLRVLCLAKGQVDLGWCLLRVHLVRALVRSLSRWYCVNHGRAGRGRGQFALRSTEPAAVDCRAERPRRAGVAMRRGVTNPLASLDRMRASSSGSGFSVSA